MTLFYVIICLAAFFFVGMYFILGGIKNSGDDNLRFLEKMKALEAKTAALDEEIKKLDDEIAVAEYLSLKKKLGRIVHKGFIAEVFFTFKENKNLYLLTGYADCVTFKRFSMMNYYDEESPCIDGKENKFKYLDDLFESDLIDGINLRKNWNKIIKYKVYKRRLCKESCKKF